MKDVKINMGKIDYFGGCPVCGGSDGQLNIGKIVWGICHKHKKRWLIGSGLFSNWKDETEKGWHRNKELLSTYEDVEPLRNPTYWAETEEYDEVASDELPF